MMIIKFSDEDITQGRNCADLGPDGDFTAERLEVDPEEWPKGWVKVRGTWERYRDGACVQAPAELRFRLDLTQARAEALARKRLDELSAGDIFTGPWEEFYIEED